MTEINIKEGDFSAVAAWGLKPEEVEALTEKWAEGGCGAFAARMHELTGWPVFLLRGSSSRKQPVPNPLIFIEPGSGRSAPMRPRPFEKSPTFGKPSGRILAFLTHPAGPCVGRSNAPPGLLDINRNGRGREPARRSRGCGRTPAHRIPPSAGSRVQAAARCRTGPSRPLPSDRRRGMPCVQA
jgi:hypothetical protein